MLVSDDSDELIVVMLMIDNAEEDDAWFRIAD